MGKSLQDFAATGVANANINTDRQNNAAGFMERSLCGGLVFLSCFGEIGGLGFVKACVPVFRLPWRHIGADIFGATDKAA